MDVKPSTTIEDLKWKIHAIEESRLLVMLTILKGRSNRAPILCAIRLSFAHVGGHRSELVSQLLDGK